jgi:hypothetical protein
MNLFAFVIGGFSLAYAIVSLDDRHIFQKIKNEQVGLFWIFGWIGHTSLGICNRFLPEAWKIKTFRSAYLLLFIISFLGSIRVWQ